MQWEETSTTAAAESDDWRLHHPDSDEEVRAPPSPTAAALVFCASRLQQRPFSALRQPIMSRWRHPAHLCYVLDPGSSSLLGVMSRGP